MPKPILQFENLAETGGLVDRTMLDIRRLIRDNRLMPGNVLPTETALAEQLGVSRNVAREALRGLAALRILDIGNGRRARVASANADALSMILDHTVLTRQVSIQQVLDVRRTLELRTTGLAAMRRSDTQARDLQAVVAGMFAALESDPDQVMELDIRFHEFIAAAAGNPLYSILVDSFSAIIRQTWHIGWRARGNYENRLENIRCHDRIAKAIVDQDTLRAEAAISEHFDNAVSVLLRAGIN